MSQYAIEPLEHRMSQEPYREWPITEPTTRRVDLWVMTPRDVRFWSKDGDDRRLRLSQDIHGDNSLKLAMPTVDAWRAVVEDPHVRQTYEAWRHDSPRYGTWRYYLETVTLMRYMIKLAGWTLTDEEERLMAALEDYGRQAPARYQTAA